MRPVFFSGRKETGGVKSEGEKQPHEKEEEEKYKRGGSHIAVVDYEQMTMETDNPTSAAPFQWNASGKKIFSSMSFLVCVCVRSLEEKQKFEKSGEYLPHVEQESGADQKKKGWKMRKLFTSGICIIEKKGQQLSSFSPFFFFLFSSKSFFFVPGTYRTRTQT